MEPHPISDIFPMMNPESFAEFADDIKLRGLIEPIVLYEKKVLDGRNRLRACELHKVKPRFIDFDGPDPLAFVLSMNLKRRHLDESQRAMVGMRIANLKHGEKKADTARQASLPISQADAAKMANVSPRSIRDAVRVGKKGLEPLARAVDEGKLAVSLAAKLADQDEATRAAAIADPDKAAHLLKLKTREGHEAALAHQIRALPTKKFGLILADPEWEFVVRNEVTGNDRAAANHYATSALDEIKSRDVPSIAADDCCLALWTTVPMLFNALFVMESWGFTYKSHCIWLKSKIGTGYWFRNVHELLLIGTRGDVPAPAPGTQWDSAWDADVGEHSEKPEEAYKLLEAYFPNLPKIELNARKVRFGWSVWGAEAPIDLESIE